MEIIYYRTEGGYTPAKEFLTVRYAVGTNDNLRVKFYKMKMFAKVESVIKMAADNKGRVGGTFSSPLTGYSFHEFRFKEGDELVRILYFPHRLEQLVLLNAYEKPDNYSKAQKKKIENEIDSIQRQTQKYYEDFLKNPKRYDNY